MNEYDSAMACLACLKEHLRIWMNERNRKGDPVGILERAEVMRKISCELDGLLFGKREHTDDD